MATSGSSPSSPKLQRVAEAPPAGTDKLMSLPAEILDRILAQVPFQKLVRTCCLSRAWRRRWESVTKLRIELPPGSSARVLWRCAPPVHGFHAVPDIRKRDIYRAARWLRALARRGVRELTLRFVPSSAVSRPCRLLGPALFSCAALVRLHLEHCYMPPAPQGFSGLPNLVSLTLIHVLLMFVGGGAQLESLIAAAPRLDELNFHDVFSITTVSVDEDHNVETRAIRATNLRKLVLSILGPIDNACRVAEALPMLEEAYISIDCLLGTQDFVDTFERIATVNKLWFISLDEPETNPLERITCKFENLREAILTTNFESHSSVLSIVSLLRFAPHIEDLDIMAYTTNEEEEDKVDEDFLNSEIRDNLFSSLKYVSLGGVRYLPNQMRFMKFVLSKAGSLQSFAVTFDDDESNKWCVKACRELWE